MYTFAMYSILVLFFPLVLAGAVLSMLGAIT